MTGEPYRIPCFDSRGKPIPEILKGPDSRGIPTGLADTTDTTSPVLVLENFILRGPGILEKSEDVVYVNAIYVAFSNAKKEGAEYIELEDLAHTWLVNKVNADASGVAFFGYNQSHIKAYLEEYEKPLVDKPKN